MTSDEEILDTQPNVAGFSCSTTCCCLPAVLHRSSIAVNCSECLKPTLVACLMNQFKLAGGCTQKYTCSYEWIHAFILHCGMRYTCQGCTDVVSRGITSCTTSGNPTAEVSTIKHALIDFDTKLAKISSNLSDFQNEINLKLRSISDEINTQTSNTPVGLSNPVTNIKNVNCNNSQSGLSYADTVSSNIKAAVKSAVVETFREQHHDKKLNESVVIYGIPEGKDDVKRVAALLEDDYLEFIVHVHRIGKQSTVGSSKPRPIRVEFGDKHDREWVMSNARYLAKNLPGLKVRISKYLCAAELSILTKLRDECAHLNRNTSDKSGKHNRYVVINDYIMEKMSDGKLRRYVAQKAVTTMTTESSVDKVK